MLNPRRFLINFQIQNIARERDFFQAMKGIDPEPLTVLANSAYAIHCNLTLDKIYALLSVCITNDDYVLVIPFDEHFATNSQAFKHWFCVLSS